MRTARRKSLLVNVTWAVGALTMLGVLYVLSYAPMYRLKYGRPLRILTAADLHLVREAPPSLPATFRTQEPRGWVPLACYAPVDWLIDHTSLRRPLLWWAGVWDVREWVESDARTRKRKREGTYVAPP
jgi:hypothetical protein